MTNSDAFDLWIPRFISYMRAKNYSKKTIDAYSRVLRMFSDGQDDVHATTEDVNEFFTAVCSHLKPNSIHQYASALETFYRFLIKQNVVGTNPVIDYSRPKIKEHELKYLRHEDVMAFLESLPNPRDKLLVRVIYATGMRISEVCSLRIEDIDFEQQTIRILGKGGKIRTVLCDATTLGMIQEHLKGRTEGYVFSGYKDQGIQPCTIQRIFRKYAPDGITPHKIRHSFATDLYQSSHDLKAVQELLGHESIKTTEIYLHTDMEQCKAAYKMRRME